MLLKESWVAGSFFGCELYCSVEYRVYTIQFTVLVVRLTPFLVVRLLDCRTVGIVGHCRNCRTVGLSDAVGRCRTVGRCTRPITQGNTVGLLSDCRTVGLSDCRTVGMLSECCRTLLSDCRTGAQPGSGIFATLTQLGSLLDALILRLGGCWLLAASRGFSRLLTAWRLGGFSRLLAACAASRGLWSFVRA